MLTFYKIDAKHAHHRNPPQYIDTSQYMQQRPNTIYRIGCQLLCIANTNIYRDTSVLIPVLIERLVALDDVGCPVFECVKWPVIQTILVSTEITDPAKTFKHVCGSLFLTCR